MLAGEAPPDPARDARLAALKERLDADARDQEFIARIEEVLLRVQSGVNVEKNHFTWGAALPEIRDALRRYGVEIGVMAPAQAAALAECRRVARPIAARGETVPLPKCRDTDDQKFLEAAAAARADVLITKDQALLELSRRRTGPPPFRIVTPHAFAASAP